MKDFATVLNVLFVGGIFVLVPTLGGGAIIILLILYGIFFGIANMAWAEIDPTPPPKKRRRRSYRRY